MRRCTLLLALLLLAGAAFGATTSHAAPRWLKDRYSGEWHACAKRADCNPGRNIRRQGLKTKHGQRRAKSVDYARSIRTFRRWKSQRTFAVRGDRVPTGAIASRPYLAGGHYAIPAPIVMCESGGNYRAVNSTNPNRPAGAYQIIGSTWIAHGGGRYAPTADQATPAQQDEIAGKIWNGGAGRSQWAC